MSQFLAIDHVSSQFTIFGILSVVGVLAGAILIGVGIVQLMSLLQPADDDRGDVR